MSKRKFEVGQRVWLDRRCAYGNARARPEDFEAFIVAGMEGRSYVLRWTLGRLNSTERIGFAKAEKLYLTDIEKDDAIWADHHRVQLVDRMWHVEPATLRRVAEVLGFDPTKEGGES